MISIRKAGNRLYYVEYNGRFVESFERKRDAEQFKLEATRGVLKDF